MPTTVPGEHTEVLANTLLLELSAGVAELSLGSHLQMKSPSFLSLLLLPEEASLMRGSSPGNSGNPGKGLEISQ